MTKHPIDTLSNTLGRSSLVKHRPITTAISVLGLGFALSRLMLTPSASTQITKKTEEAPKRMETSQESVEIGREPEPILEVLERELQQTASLVVENIFAIGRQQLQRFLGLVESSGTMSINRRYSRYPRVENGTSGRSDDSVH